MMNDRPTCIADLMDEKLLAEMIEQKCIRVQEHPSMHYKIYNYTETAVFSKTWNKATLQCRGLITDREGFIVARPWKKFFNSGEELAPKIEFDEPVEIVDKMDGSLGIGYPLGHGVWAVATRGSFFSNQAEVATDWLQRHSGIWKPVSRITPLWEIIYPENRIVLDYGMWEGLVLLGAVNNDDGTYYGPTEASYLLNWLGEVAETLVYSTLADYLTSPDTDRPNAEGVVVRAGHRMMKLKEEWYVRAHAIVTGVSNRSVWAALAAGEGVPEQASFMPDEFYRWLIATAATLTEAKVAWENEVMKQYLTVLENMPIGGSRKDFAKLALQSPYSAALFKLYDCQLIDSMAWQAVRPAVFERPFTQSQDNN